MEKILLVEDEGYVADVITQFLELWGYPYLVARDTAQGLDLFERERERIRLVLMDIKMPHGFISGLELGDILKQRYAFENIVYMTGFTDEPETKEELIRRNRPCLQKPFEFDDLKKAIEGTFRP